MDETKDIESTNEDNGVPEQESPEKSLSDQIREGFLSGKADQELIAEGFNKNSVRIIAHDLEKEGLRKRPPKGSGGSAGGGAPPLQVFAKGSPPEAIINTLNVPGEGLDGFESGMKFGMSLIVAGVRIAQELSTAGVQQARPLMDMARDMRAGEAAAAKNAAIEAAASTAGQVQTNLIPYLTQLDNRISGIEKPTSSNPFGGMMMRMFEPILQNMMGRFLPMPMSGPGQEEGPGGWTRKQEEV